MNGTKNSKRKGKPTKKHVVTRLILVVLIASPLSLFYGLYLTTWRSTGVQRTAWISWYDDPQTKVYVGWETEESVIGTVNYGIQQGNLNLSESDPVSTQFHTVNLTGLTPNTKYYYEVEVEGDVYASGEFQTAPSSQTPFSFGLYADTQPKVGPGWHARTGEIFDGKNYSFVSMVGDFVEDGEKFEWNYFFKEASQYLDTIPFIPVIGNHDKPRDLDDDGTDEYYFGNYFAQTEDTQINPFGNNSYDVYQQFYFSFNWSSVHFQVLHFPEVDIDDFDDPGGVNQKDYYRAFTPDHLAWIKEDLNNSQSLPFRVTLFHCPITSAGFYGPNFILMEQLLPILHEYNVTVTVHGHSHHYERGILENTKYPENPLTYLVVGCGGGLTDVGLRPVPETQVAIASPCYVEGNATASTLAFTAYSFEGNVIDSITFDA